MGRGWGGWGGGDREGQAAGDQEVGVGHHLGAKVEGERVGALGAGGRAGVGDWEMEVGSCSQLGLEGREGGWEETGGEGGLVGGSEQAVALEREEDLEVVVMEEQEGHVQVAMVARGYWAERVVMVEVSGEEDGEVEKVTVGGLVGDLVRVEKEVAVVREERPREAMEGGKGWEAAWEKEAMEGAEVVEAIKDLWRHHLCRI